MAVWPYIALFRSHLPDNPFAYLYPLHLPIDRITQANAIAALPTIALLPTIDRQAIDLLPIPLTIRRSTIA